MNSNRSVLALALVAALGGAVAIAQQSQPSKTAPTKAQPPAQPDKMQLPPGISEADMKACMDAATPGPNQEFLAKGVGTWNGKCKMWMTPDTDPATNDCTAKVTSILDGRFTKCETTGEMPGMGPFKGFGLYGYDNVGHKFQSTWVDNFGTGMMQGTGELSADGKTLTWTCTYTCPIQKKPITVREIDRHTSDSTWTMEMYGPEPHTGKEYKTMEITFTRASGNANADETTISR